MEARFAFNSYLKTRPNLSELLLLTICPTTGRPTTVVFVHQHYMGPSPSSDEELCSALQSDLDSISKSCVQAGMVLRQSTSVTELGIKESARNAT